MKNFLFVFVFLFSSVTALSQTAEEYFERGVNKYSSGDFSGALRDFSKAIKLKPDFAEAYHRRGNARMSGYNPNTEAAIADYSKSIELEPLNPKAYNNRGLVMNQIGDQVKALDDFDMAVKLDPTAVYAYKNRGDVKKLLGDKRGAIADYEKASDLETEKKEESVSKNDSTAIKEDVESVELEVEASRTTAQEVSSKNTEKAVVTQGAMLDMSSFIPVENELHFAGDQLQKARRTFGVGFFFNLIGGGLMVGSLLTTNSKAKIGLGATGGVFSLVGSIVMLTAVIPVGKAGISLQKVHFPRTLRIELE